MTNGTVVRVLSEGVYATVKGRPQWGPGWILDNPNWKTVRVYQHDQIKVVA